MHLCRLSFQIGLTCDRDLDHRIRNQQQRSFSFGFEFLKERKLRPADARHLCRHVCRADADTPRRRGPAFCLRSPRECYTEAGRQDNAVSPDRSSRLWKESRSGCTWRSRSVHIIAVAHPGADLGDYGSATVIRSVVIANCEYQC